MAAETLKREWIGIDLTYLATGAVKLQIEKYFPQLRNEITITGTPENVQQALDLARTSPQNFEEWTVTHVLKFKANAKKVADGGIDGTMNFPLGRIQGKQAYGKSRRTSKRRELYTRTYQRLPDSNEQCKSRNGRFSGNDPTINWNASRGSKIQDI